MERPRCSAKFPNTRGWTSPITRAVSKRMAVSSAAGVPLRSPENKITTAKSFFRMTMLLTDLSLRNYCLGIQESRNPKTGGGNPTLQSSVLFLDSWIPKRFFFGDIEKTTADDDGLLIEKCVRRTAC